MAVVAQRLFAEQFLGGEFAAQADVVMDADRLIDALGPMRHDMLIYSIAATIWLRVIALKSSPTAMNIIPIVVRPIASARTGPRSK